MSTSNKRHERTRAQESSSAIERMYITMRHLFNRGFYKPMGVSGETLREALLLLRPEIYGSIAEEKAELEVYKLHRNQVDQHVGRFKLAELKQLARDSSLPVGGTKVQVLLRLVQAGAVDLAE